MPLVTIDTNLPASKVPSGFLLRLSKLIAEALNKDEARVKITLNTDRQVCVAGNDSPALLMEIKFIGEIDDEKNKRCSESFFKFLHSETNLPFDRLTVFYTLLRKDQVGIVPVAN